MPKDSKAEIIQKLIKEERTMYANLFIARALDKIGKAKYAVFAAEQVINIWDKQFPNDDRPRKAIEVAKKYINNPTLDISEEAACISKNAFSAAETSYDIMVAKKYMDNEHAIYASACSAANAAYMAGNNSIEYITNATYNAVINAYISTAFEYCYILDSNYGKSLLIKILQYGISVIVVNTI